MASRVVPVALVWSPIFGVLYWVFIRESLGATLIGLGRLATAYCQDQPGIEKFLLAVFTWTVAALPLGLLLVWL